MGACHRRGLRGTPRGGLDPPDDGRHREGVGRFPLTIARPYGSLSWPTASRRERAIGEREHSPQRLAQARRVRTIDCGGGILVARCDRALDAIDEAPVHALKLLARPNADLIVIGLGRILLRMVLMRRTSRLSV